MSTSLPILPGPSVVPSATCLQCEICCRFPEKDSPLRPYFTKQEIQAAIAQGVSPDAFSDQRGCQISVVPHPQGEGYLCPAFDPQTHHCRIYPVRPFDCQLYPFALMWDTPKQMILFGWDTLCPFLIDQVGAPSLSPFDHEGLPSQPLPSPLLERGRAVAQNLESEPLLSTLVANPTLVTNFQPQVVILQSLPHLTAHLQPPTPSS